MYCDDTSGNSSKKWNKHNSFLFNLAGLPKEEVHKEYNIHFLCTSNVAPPLEMSEGIVKQLEYVFRLFVLVSSNTLTLTGNTLLKAYGLLITYIAKGFF